MSCSNCGSTTAGCGCKDTAYTTPIVTTCVPACPPKCAEYISATCVLMQDGIDELGSNPGDTIESIIQRLTLIITNPLCVDWNPGSGGGGGGGGGIIQVGLVAPSNLFETPIVPVTTPGGDLTLTLNDQASNTVFAGPTSGPDGTPQFRALVVDDLPDLTTGNCVLRGDGAGKFACVTIGPNLSYSGGVLDANVNVVIGAENGLTKDPANTDTVWLGGPSTAPGVLDFDTFIDTTDQFRLNLYGDNPAVKRGVLEVEHTLDQAAIKATADDGTAVSANIINGVTAVYASSTGSGIGLTAESNSGTAVIYTSTSGAGIIGDSASENIFTVNSTTPPSDSIVSPALRLTKNYNSSSAIGIGSRLEFGFYNSSAADRTSSTIESITTNVTNATETADIRFSTIGNGTIEIVGQFIGGSGVLNGQLRLNKYGINTFNVGTPVYGLAVDAQGKVMEVPLATGLGTVDNGLRLNPSLASQAWLGGTLVDDTTITVPDATLFEISGATVTATESVLEINNTAGATGTRALSVSSGGLEPAAHITQSTTATSSSVKVINDSTNASAYGLDVETKSLPIWARTTQTANTTQVQLLKLHNQTGGSGGNGVGGYISLNAATVGNADQEAARIGYQFTDAATSTRKGQLEFYTANGAAPAQRMTIKETGQVQLNNYTTSTSFTTVVGASLLGIDTSGNVVNSVGKEGLSFNSANGNIELGRSSLAGTSDFSVRRYINTGLYNLTLSSDRVGITGPGTNDSMTVNISNTGNGGALNLNQAGSSGIDPVLSVNCTSNYYGAITSNITNGVSIQSRVYGSGYGLRVDGYGNNAQGIYVYMNGVGNYSAGASINTSYGTAVSALTQGGYALYATATDPLYSVCQFRSIQDASTTITEVLNLDRTPKTTLTSVDGIGLMMTFSAPNSNLPGSVPASNRSTSLASKWTTADYNTRSSEFYIEAVDTAVTYTVLQITGTGIFTLSRGLSNYANDAAAALGGIPVNGLYRNGSVVQIRVV